MNLPEQISARKIRSYTLRQGRVTQGQQFAMDHYWDEYCLDPKIELDYASVFKRAAPLVLEIGFGNGLSLAEMASVNAMNNYIGVEVHRPGVGQLMMNLHNQSLRNVRIYCHDAIEILQHCIADKTLDGVNLFFPDPWPKKRHHKRRIVNEDFIALISRKLKSKAYFHAATDWQDYAEEMLKVLSSSPDLKNTSRTGDFCERPAYRPLTKFENRGMKLGHGVWDLIFIKT